MCHDAKRRCALQLAARNPFALQLAVAPAAAAAAVVQSYAEYNAWASKEPDYVESGKSVEHVVRSVNIQM